MVNNVGKTTQNLSTQLGEATPFTNTESITLLTGEIGKGLLLFDPVELSLILQMKRILKLQPTLYHSIFKLF